MKITSEKLLEDTFEYGVRKDELETLGRYTEILGAAILQDSFSSSESRSHKYQSFSGFARQGFLSKVISQMKQSMKMLQFQNSEVCKKEKNKNRLPLFLGLSWSDFFNLNA